MKPNAVALTVMLLMAGMLLVSGSCITKNKTEAATPESNIIVPEESTGAENAAPLAEPEHKQETTPTAAKLKFTKPSITKIEVEGESTHCVVLPPLPNEKDSADTIL